MKGKIFFLSMVLVGTMGAYTQTNTFPASGRVGIGTTSPGAPLDVEGNILMGLGWPAYGIMMRMDFPGITGGWARGFSINDQNDESFIMLGSYGHSDNGVLDLHYSYIGEDYDDTYMVFLPDGNVGIGTTEPGTYKLAVNGKVHAKEVKVDMDGWADYVFEKDYDLPTLEEVEQHIRDRGRLADVPSAAEVARNGIGLGEMNRVLLKKIEELTLYILEQDKQIKLLKTLEERIAKLENRPK